MAPFSRFEDCKRVRVIAQTLCPAHQANPLAILVAENDPCDALLLEQAIFQAGLHVPLHFVTDGQDAIDYLRGHPPFDNRAAHPLPTLLLLELDLPGVNGLGVLQWLQRQPGLSRIHVVILSSCSEREAIHQAYTLGADSYLLKPKTESHTALPE